MSSICILVQKLVFKLTVITINHKVLEATIDPSDSFPSLLKQSIFIWVSFIWSSNIILLLYSLPNSIKVNRGKCVLYGERLSQRNKKILNCWTENLLVYIRRRTYVLVKYFSFFVMKKSGKSRRSRWWRRRKLKIALFSG